jgi:hypothetical protein
MEKTWKHTDAALKAIRAEGRRDLGLEPLIRLRRPEPKDAASSLLNEPP